MRKAEHDLGCAIPSHRDVFGQKLVCRYLVEPACLPEIANLELAVRIHEEVTGLEVAMQYTSRVDVFQTAERLVDERLEVRVREGLARTNLRKEMFRFVVRWLAWISCERNCRLINLRTMAWRSASMGSK